MAVKPTIKEVDGEGRVIKTLVRAGLWEVQTPQVQLSDWHRAFSGPCASTKFFASSTSTSLECVVDAASCTLLCDAIRSGVGDNGALTCR